MRSPEARREGPQKNAAPENKKKRRVYNNDAAGTEGRVSGA
jgi:hypothetical protein